MMDEKRSERLKVFRNNFVAVAIHFVLTMVAMALFLIGVVVLSGISDIRPWLMIPPLIMVSGALLAMALTGGSPEEGMFLFMTFNASGLIIFSPFEGAVKKVENNGGESLNKTRRL